MVKATDGPLRTVPVEFQERVPHAERETLVMSSRLIGQHESILSSLTRTRFVVSLLAVHLLGEHGESVREDG